ncbi:hypothetical protein SARC_14391, partial [Sphaeroforma arctica JP610]
MLNRELSEADHACIQNKGTAHIALENQLSHNVRSNAIIIQCVLTVGYPPAAEKYTSRVTITPFEKIV